MKIPDMGYFLEIKSRTWSRKDAERKAQLAADLVGYLGASDGQYITSDYFGLIS